MKKLELQNFGVQELDAKEMKETDGGSVWGLVKETFAAVYGAGADFIGGIGTGYNRAHTERILAQCEQIA